MIQKYSYMPEVMSGKQDTTLWEWPKLAITCEFSRDIWFIIWIRPSGNIRSYDSSYKLAANSQGIWYFILTFKYSLAYCLTGFSKIYWWLVPTKPLAVSFESSWSGPSGFLGDAVGKISCSKSGSFSKESCRRGSGITVSGYYSW